MSAKKKSITISLDLKIYNRVRKCAKAIEKKHGFRISDAKIAEKLIKDALEKGR